MEDETKTDNQTLSDYSMYKIYPKNKELNYCYIGHTNDFNARKRQHKLISTSEKHNKLHFKIYQTIRQNGGWDEWEMIKLEEFNGKTNLEARIREQELIKEHNANLNSLSAYITEEERAATKKAITEKYREENKELLKEQTKKYKQEHKEIIAEQMKTYREENKDKIREKNKEYKENNKEKFEEWDKAWREKNKEILKEKRKIYEAKKKAEKLLAEAENPVITITEEEKEAIKKEKRDKYNENRRLKRIQDKQNEPVI
jgi:hypothetical protein